MSIFALDNETLKEKKAVFTATEIDQQPKVWQRTIDILAEKKEELEQFIQNIAGTFFHTLQQKL